MIAVGLGTFRRIGLFGIGILLKKGLDYIFDYVLYPIALLYFGIWVGGAIMTMVSVVVNFIIIRVYDYFKTDALFIESVKISEARPNLSLSFKAFLSRSKFAVFIFLSWVEDPVVVTLFFRKGGNLYNGMAFADWRNFICSTIVSNLFWVLSVGSFLEVFAYIF